jgi:hypothetical protein
MGCCGDNIRPCGSVKSQDDYGVLHTLLCCALDTAGQTAQHVHQSRCVGVHAPHPSNCQQGKAHDQAPAVCKARATGRAHTLAWTAKHADTVHLHASCTVALNALGDSRKIRQCSVCAISSRRTHRPSTIQTWQEHPHVHTLEIPTGSMSNQLAAGTQVAHAALSNCSVGVDKRPKPTESRKLFCCRKSHQTCVPWKQITFAFTNSQKLQNCKPSAPQPASVWSDPTPEPAPRPYLLTQPMASKISAAEVVPVIRTQGRIAETLACVQLFSHSACQKHAGCPATHMLYTC